MKTRVSAVQGRCRRANAPLSNETGKGAHSAKQNRVGSERSCFEWPRALGWITERLCWVIFCCAIGADTLHLNFGS
jgi:hypothetical protein